MNNIQILDCTLRDGGYVNNWQFDDEVTISVINSLIATGIEIIECGFISHTKGKDKDCTLFSDMDVINDLLKEVDKPQKHQSFVCLLNFGECDVNKFPNCDNQDSNSITGLRVAFHKEKIDEAFEDVKILIEKGYKVFVQPMVSMRYKDIELIQLIEKFNPLNPYAIYIVDSFGSMSQIDFQRFYYLFENNVKKGIKIGYHSHNNLQLAFSNAVSFTEIYKNNEIIIDSSIYGMGRGAGNLNSELVADYLNKTFDTNYTIVYLLDVIESYLMGIYKETPWGFSPAHFLSASFHCHPNYATFLTSKKTISIAEIKQILASIDEEKMSSFDKDYIARLYFDFNKNKLNDKVISSPIFNRDILLLASGPSINNERFVIDEHIKSHGSIVIGLNHIVEGIDCDYVFFSNQKRYDKYADNIKGVELIVSSNIRLHNNSVKTYVVDYEMLMKQTVTKVENVAIIFMLHLLKENINRIAVAGLDGYNVNSINNYSYKEYDRTLDRKILEQKNKEIESEIINLTSMIEINFITKSLFQKYETQSIGSNPR